MRRSQLAWAPWAPRAVSRRRRRTGSRTPPGRGRTVTGRYHRPSWRLRNGAAIWGHCGRPEKRLILTFVETARRPSVLPALPRRLARWVGGLPPVALIGLTLAVCLGLAAVARLLGSSAWLWALLAG